MSHHFGALLVLLTFTFGGYLSVMSIDVNDLTQSQCRIAGVALVESRDRKQNLNYTMAESACQVLGLQLASKAQVERANGYRYESCSFGWVSEKFLVIPRINNNENCGKNKTGVLSWTVELGRPSKAYCFNVSDIRINSCKPELMVTEPPSTVAVPTSAGVPTIILVLTTKVVPTSADTTSLTYQKTETQTRPILTSRPNVKTTLIASTSSAAPTLTERTMPITTPTPTFMVDTEPSRKQENQMAQKNERVVFGGLPTTLLILALVFFIAAVVLAVCYIKKYNTHLFLINKKQKKESVETKVFKDNTKEDERVNGKESESPQKSGGNSLEAEV